MHILKSLTIALLVMLVSMPVYATDTISLPAGHMLTITADANSIGTYWQLRDTNNANPGAPASLTVSSSATIGPYNVPTTWGIDSTVGTLTSASSAVYFAGTDHPQELSSTPTAISGRYRFYAKDDDLGYYQDGAGTEHLVGGFPVFKSYTFAARSAASGEYFSAGFYDHPAADADLTNVSTTQTHGDADISYAAHAFVVMSGAGSTDGSDLIVTITGTSITDAGVRNGSDSQVIVTDCTASTTDQYLETSKKWVGQITYTLSSTAGSTFDCTFNYGLAKYDDFGNRAFTITDFEAVGLANAADTGFNIELIHHTETGWTYHATAFHPITATNTIINMNTDHGTEQNIGAGEQFAYKRSGLTTAINGANGNGLIVRVTTSVNNSVSYMTMHIGATF